MLRLLKFMRGYIKETVLGPLFKLFEATLELIVPLVVAAIIDEGISTGDGSFIVRSCLLLAAMGAVGLAFSLTAQYFSAKAAVGFITKIKAATFKKTQTLSYADLDKIGTSTMITRMTADATKVQNGVNLTLRLLLRSPFVVFGSMIMAFTIDLHAAIVFVLAIFVLSIVVFGIMLITKPLYTKVQKGTDTLLCKTGENLRGVRVIRAFGKEEDEINEFNEKNDFLTKLQLKVGRISALLNPLTYVLINVAILILIYVGAIKVNDGVLTDGQVVALYNYMSMILVELIKLANLIITISKALASAKRIADVLDMESTERDGALTEGMNTDYAVEFENVSMKYAGSQTDSLHNLAFRAKKGETVGIIGGTGSGKTTLVNLIPAFYIPTEGIVKIDGYSAAEYDKKYLRKSIGIVPQKAVLFKGTVRDNLSWSDGAATDEEIYDALRTAQAYDLVKEKGGLDFEIEQGGKNLSGGQRQRLTIARALVGAPRILILDDSSSALDFATEAALRKALREISADTTVFIVSQRASSIMHADKIIVLDDGEPVGIGTHAELMKDCEVYREIYYSQFEKEDK